MADIIPNISLNMSDVFKFLPEEVTAPLHLATFLLKAIGVFISIYLIIQLINLFLNFRRNKRLKTIEARIDTLEKKIDIIVEKFTKKNLKKSDKKEV